MMRAIAASAVVALIALSQIARAGDMPPLAAPIAQCINDNAAKVEAAIPDLNQAVDFLVLNVCAGPVAEQQQLHIKRTAEKSVARLQKMCDDEKGADKTKPAPSYCNSLKLGFMSEPNNIDEDYFGIVATASSKPAAAAALASRLLLDLRLSHMAVKGAK
jgi:hypothetical protein